MAPTLNQVLNCLPSSTFIDVKVKNTQNTEDLIKAISESHKFNIKYAHKIAHLFKGNNDYQTGLNIHKFLRSHVPYKIEPGTKQTTRTLPRMLDDAEVGIGSDCKHYSIFTGTILQALKIPFKYRFAGYSSSTPQHIYCIMQSPNLNGDIVIDAVLPEYNYEKKPKSTKDMALYQLSGVEIGKVKKPLFKKPIFKKAAEKTKTIGLAIPRNAFLLLLDFNVNSFATKLNELQTKKGDSVLSFWTKFGGDLSKLKQAIQKGKLKKPVFKISGTEDEMIGSASLAAAAASAVPIIIVVVKALKANGVNLPEGTDGLIKAAEDKFGEDTGTPLGDTAFKAEEGKDTDKTEVGKSDSKDISKADAERIEKATGSSIFTPKNLMIGAGVLLIGGGIAYAVKKKK